MSVHGHYHAWSFPRKFEMEKREIQRVALTICFEHLLNIRSEDYHDPRDVIKFKYFARLILTFWN